MKQQSKLNKTQEPSEYGKGIEVFDYGVKYGKKKTATVNTLAIKLNNITLFFYNCDVIAMDTGVILYCKHYCYGAKLSSYLSTLKLHFKSTRSVVNDKNLEKTINKLLSKHNLIFVKDYSE